MKLVRHFALLGLFTLSAAPSEAQWVAGTGDDFSGTSLDKSVWGFNIAFPDALGSPVINTEKPDLYEVSGGSLTDHGVNAANGYNPLYRGIISDTNGQVYANFATVKVTASPAAGWYVQTAFSLDDTAQQSGGYPIFGILLLKNASHWAEWAQTHFGFASGNGPINAYQFSLLGSDGTGQRSDFMEGGNNNATSVAGGGSFFTPYLPTDIYTERVEYFPPADPNGERIEFSSQVEGATPHDLAVIGTISATSSNPSDLALFNLIKNPVGLQVGLHAGSQGTTENNSVAFDYFHTNLSVAGAAAGAVVTGSIALEGVPNLAAIAPAAPLGKFDIQIRSHSSGAVVFENKNVTLTAASGNASGQYSLSVTGVAPGTYDVWIKGGKNLAVLVPSVTVTANGGTIANVLLPAADGNNDNSVDTSDFGVLVGGYNGDSAIPGSGYDPAADFNFDGVVDTSDFSLLVGQYNNVGAN